MTTLGSAYFQPHWETNEDGTRFGHPGYEEIECPLCHNPILCVKGYIAPICGRKNCKVMKEE